MGRCRFSTAKGRIERLFDTLQDRLVKEMRVREINTLEAANRFLELTFWPWREKRFGKNPAQSKDDHWRLERTHRWEEIKESCKHCGRAPSCGGQVSDQHRKLVPEIQRILDISADFEITAGLILASRRLRTCSNAALRYE